MLERLSRNKRNLALAGIGIALVAFAWSVRSVLNPLILGYLLAYIVHPLVERLERSGWRRARAVNLIYLVGFLGISLLALGLAQQSISLVRKLTSENRDLVTNAIDRVEDFVRGHPSWFQWALPEEPQSEPAAGPEGAPPAGGAAAEQAAAAGPTGGTGQQAEPAQREVGLAALARGLWAKLAEEREGDARSVAVRGAASAWGIVQRAFGSLMALVGMIVLLPIYAYFLLFELDRVHGFVRHYLPKRERERFSRIGLQIGEMLSNFFRGRLLVCLLKGAFLTIGLLIAGVDYALLLGIFSGMLSLVPFVGPFLGFLFASLVALLSPDYGVVGALLRTGIVFGAGELVEGYVLVPKILGDKLGLHPVVVLVSVFVGGAALGMFGFLIALPLTATFVILGRELVLPALEDFAEEDDEPEPAAPSPGTGAEGG